MQTVSRDLITMIDQALIRGDVEEARRLAREVLSRRPDQAATARQIGVAFGRRDFHEDSFSYYALARDLEPENHLNHWYCGLHYMREVHSRNLWVDSFRRAIECNGKLAGWWDGSARSREILVIAGGGIGDIVYNLRYAKQLRRCADRVSIATRAYMLDWIRKTDTYDEVVDINEVDRYIAKAKPRLMRHEYLAGIMDKNLLDSQYYECLYSSHSRAERMKALLPRKAKENLLIGICWKGKDNSVHHQGRSMEINDLEPLAKIENASFVSLQFDNHEDETKSCRWAKGNLAKAKNIGNNFLETTALIACCDIIVSCDTGLAHTAAGLGKRTIVLCKETAPAYWKTDGRFYPESYCVSKRQRQTWEGACYDASQLIAGVMMGAYK